MRGAWCERVGAWIQECGERMEGGGWGMVGVYRYRMCGVEVHAYGVQGRVHGWGGIDGLSRWMV